MYQGVSELKQYASSREVIQIDGQRCINIPGQAFIMDIDALRAPKREVEGIRRVNVVKRKDRQGNERLTTQHIFEGGKRKNFAVSKTMGKLIHDIVMQVEDIAYANHAMSHNAFFHLCLLEVKRHLPIHTQRIFGKMPAPHRESLITRHIELWMDEVKAERGVDLRTPYEPSDGDRGLIESYLASQPYLH